MDSFYPTFDSGVGSGWGPPGGMASLIEQSRNAGAGGVQAAEQSMEYWKQRKDQTKALRQVVKSYAPDGPDGDALKHWSETAGLGDLQGFVQGQAAQTQRQETQARSQDLQAQADQRMRDTRDSQVLQQVWQSYGDKPDTAKITPTDFMSRYMSKGGSPYGLAKAGQFLKDVTGKEAGDDLPTNIFNVPSTGQVFVTRGKQILPAGVDPETVKSQGGPIIAPAGDYYHDGKKWIPVKSTGYPAGSKFVNVNGAVAVMGPDNRILSYKMESPQAQMVDALKSAGDSRPVAEETPVAPKDLPDSKDKLVKNTVYQTARGPATWDGAQFKPVK